MVRSDVQVGASGVDLLELYGGGMDLLAIQELLGHRWVATTMRYVHVLATHVEDAWIAGQERAARRLEGLLS